MFPVPAMSKFTLFLQFSQSLTLPKRKFNCLQEFNSVFRLFRVSFEYFSKACENKFKSIFKILLSVIISKLSFHGSSPGMNTLSSMNDGKGVPSIGNEVGEIVNIVGDGFPDGVCTIVGVCARVGEGARVGDGVGCGEGARVGVCARIGVGAIVVDGVCTRVGDGVGCGEGAHVKVGVGDGVGKNVGSGVFSET